MTRTSTILLMTLATSAGVVGCVRAGSADHFQKTAVQRASFDLQCDGMNIVATDLGNNQVGVRGCGRQAVYLYEQYSNTWVNNSAAPEKAEKAK